MVLVVLLLLVLALLGAVLVFVGVNPLIPGGGALDCLMQPPGAAAAACQMPWA
jgi:hypothetical protein